MTTNKKLVVTVGVMAVALVLALTGIIVVLVTANQRASSAVNVKYISSDVAVTLSATAYLGSNSYVFTKGGVVGGETELVLSPTVTEGTLSQTSDIASFDLTKTNTYVVFEYVFQNKTGNIDVKIDQDGIPATKENINLTYTYSDTQISNFALLEDNAEFTAQLLPAYTGEETVKYVYIKAQIADLLYDSNLVGDFGWALSKPQTSEINTVTLNVANADYIERTGSNLTNSSVTSNYTYKTLATSVDAEDISIVPAVVDKSFVGWSETEGGTVISAIDMPNDETHNTLRGTTAKTLYPVYKDGNVTMVTTATYAKVSGMSDTSATEVIIPDITTHEGAIVKVTTIGEYAFSFLDYSGLTNITIPRYISNLEECGLAESVFASISVSPGNTVYDSRDNCNAVIETATNTLIQGSENTIIPSSVTHIASEAFMYISLTTITIPSSMKSIGEYAFFASSLRSIIIPSSVTSIEDFAFSHCHLESITIPSSVISIGSSAFENCGLTSITIPNSVTSIGASAFYSSSLTSITFEDTTTWEKASNSTFTSNVSTVDVTDPSQNATWLVNTSGYYNYHWRKV